jgi:hypothetical protein
VGLFVQEMLSKSDTFRLATDSEQEVVGPDDEVGQGLVVDDALLDGLTDAHVDGLAVRDLVFSGEEGESLVFVVLELAKGLVLRVDEVLDFGEGELSDPEETGPGGDFVSEAETDLGTTEGDATAVVLEEVSEVNEHALSSFGSKETLGIASGADLDAKHEVEFVRLGEAVASFGGLDAEGLDDGGDILEFVVGEVLSDGFELEALFWSELFVLGEGVFDVLGVRYAMAVVLLRSSGRLCSRWSSLSRP